MAPEADRVLVDAGDFADAPAALIEEAVLRTLAAAGRPDVEISVALLGGDDIRELNRRYLGKDSATDVIAFTLGEGSEIVGDVYIGVSQALRQACELGVPLREELARLAIHGTLHVLGHDHPEGPEREESPMFQLQERLLRDLLRDSQTA
jgi:probable rRNA maturation factor